MDLFSEVLDKIYDGLKIKFTPKNVAYGDRFLIFNDYRKSQTITFHTKSVPYWIDFDGDGSMDVDLPAMGADPNSPDVFVYYDWMHKDADWRLFGIPFGEKNLKPDAEVFGLIARQFWNHGIRFHAIEGRGIPYEDIFDLGNGGTDYSNWNSTAVTNFPRKYWNVARYALMVNKIGCNDVSPDVLLGIAEAIPGQFVVVADGLIKSSYKDSHNTRKAINLMHELGHTFGLGHGGNDHVLYKPNYLSVMNYLYNETGLIVNTSETWRKVNYSDYELPSLNELNIDETRGLDPEGDTKAGVRAKWILATTGGGTKTIAFRDRPSPSRAGAVGISGQSVDFNDNGTMESSIAVDFYVESGDTNTSNQVIPQYVYPPNRTVSSDAVNGAQFRREYISKLAEHIGWEFYPHDRYDVDI